MYVVPQTVQYGTRSSPTPEDGRKKKKKKNGSHLVVLPTSGAEPEEVS